jgi:hypothetical protein
VREQYYEFLMDEERNKVAKRVQQEAKRVVDMLLEVRNKK